MRGKSISVLENYLVSAPFDSALFLEKVRSYLPALNEDDRWIRSGNRIADKYKNLLSSYKLLGSSRAAQGRLRVEVLLIKPVPLSPISKTAVPTLEFIREYQAENRVDAVFAALLSTVDETWQYFFTADCARDGIHLPDDLLSYTVTNVIKNYLAKSCSLSAAALEGYFSRGYVLYDDTAIREKARQIDEALSAIEVCDISAGTGTLLMTAAERIADIRCDMSKYIASEATRSRESFLARFAANSLFATDLDAGALELLKLYSAKKLGALITAAHVEYGSILTEDLFGGKKFDVLITNPPHMRQEEFAEIKQSFSGYKVFHKSADLYCYYMERALSLLKDGGCAGIIASNRWMRSEYGAPLRSFLSKSRLTDIVDYGNVPLPGETSMPVSAITVLQGEKLGKHSVRVTRIEDKNFDNIMEVVENEAYPLDSQNLGEEPWTLDSQDTASIMRKIAAEGTPLEEYSDGKIYRGVLTGLNEAFVIDADTADDFIKRDARSRELLRPLAGGRNVRRYAPLQLKKYLIFIPKGFTNKARGASAPWEWLTLNYPVITEHLQKFEQRATARRDKGDYWWELRSCKYYDVFEHGKITSPAIVKRISATMDEGGAFSNDKTSVIAMEDYYLLGLLNSHLMDFYARRITSGLLNDYYELKPANLAALPIRKIIETNKYQTNLRNAVAENAKRLLAHNAAQSDDAEAAAEAERIINKAVYKLYRLTPREIRTVENN